MCAVDLGPGPGGERIRSRLSFLAMDEGKGLPLLLRAVGGGACFCAAAGAVEI